MRKFIFLLCFALVAMLTSLSPPGLSASVKRNGMLALQHSTALHVDHSVGAVVTPALGTHHSPTYHAGSPSLALERPTGNFNGTQTYDKILGASGIRVGSYTQGLRPSESDRLRGKKTSRFHAFALSHLSWSTAMQRSLPLLA